ncbi:MAG TPA: UDP-N-acetylmuramoyl-L-alanyl-D-glutamate--2,6-diaminopimelate ligase [Coxiellaceae bacterium]|nr:UDP-N-acetylmuramoyl-L-alanyl-D-glutamate--2,6-diaminopimelate ligase [Coxiellaceae bacterium]
MSHLTLEHLLNGLAQLSEAERQIPIHALALHTDSIVPGTLFFAYPGNQNDGCVFIEPAIQKGAVAVICDAACSRPVTSIPCIPIPHLRQHISEIAARFYGNPSHDLTLIGVTGTNGKTSVAHFIAQTLSCGFMGTIGIGTVEALAPSPLTTLDPINIQHQLAEFKTKGFDTVAMEVSSHALAQDRVQAVEFDVAIFTNLTHDHLDYHGDMACYADAKAKLFQMPSLRFAISNWDDCFGRFMLDHTRAQSITYSLYDDQADVYIQDIHAIGLGYRLHLSTPWGKGIVTTELLGDFNLSNLLCALATLNVLGIPFEESLNRISTLKPVPGRLERFVREDGLSAFVDYAHTPDALEKVLKVLRAHTEGKLWCVFGCGGDRDRAKRPMMARVAEKYCDQIIITNDNPRTELPNAIIADIQAGLLSSKKTRVIPDRKKAIEMALSQAKSKDKVLIAGKGHETYQIMGEERLPFDDRACVRMCFSRETVD